MPYRDHVLFSFLQLLHVPYTKKNLDTVVSKLAGNNTLSVISDVLNRDYNVENVCLLIEKDDITKLEAPFLIQLDLPAAPIVIVTDIHSDKISLIYKNKKYTQPSNFILERWNGTVLLAEANKSSRELDYWQNRLSSLVSKSPLPFFVLVFSLILLKFRLPAILRLVGGDSFHLVLLSLYMIGLTVTSLLLVHQIGQNGSFVERVCKRGGKKGCSGILQSKAANFLGLVSWSEVGFFYFVASSIAFISVDGSENVLYLLSIITLPYTIWSLFYQWRIAKEWCLFCLTIQLTFWLIFSTYLIDYQFRLPQIESSVIVRTGACYLLVASFLWLLLPYVKGYYKFVRVNFEYQSLKFNPAIIQSSFELIDPIDITAASNIVFGTTDSEVTLSILTDVYCGHCIEAHKHIKELMEVYRDRISCRIIFAIPEYIPAGNESYNTIVTQKHKIIKGLIGIYKNSEIEVSEAVFNHWYEKGKDDYAKFLKKHQNANQGDLIEEEFEKQLKWFKKLGYPGTPAIFINNRQMPTWYEANEISALIRGMLT